MLGHVAHNSGSQAALLDFCLTNLPRAAPQSPGVYPFQPKTVTMTAICRGAVKCVRREEVLDWMLGYCNVAMHFTFFSKDVERSVSSSTQSSSLHNIRSRNAPSGQLWDCLYQSSITRTKKGAETTPYAGSLRTGQLSSLMCPIAPLEHHWAWACHVPTHGCPNSFSIIDILGIDFAISKRSTVTSWFRGWSYPSLLISFFAFWLSRLCQDPAFLLGLALSVCHVRMDSQLTFLAASWPLPFTIPKYCHRISNAARPAVIAAAKATEALSDLAAKRIQRMCVRPSWNPRVNYGRDLCKGQDLAPKFCIVHYAKWDVQPFN